MLADGHGPPERHVLHSCAVGVRGRRVPVDAVLLRSNVHVAELRDKTRGQGRGFRGPQDIRAGRHQLRVHRPGDILRVHRAHGLPADRRPQIQDTVGVHLPDQLVRQPVLVHHTHRQFQTRSNDYIHQVSKPLRTVR